MKLGDLDGAFSNLERLVDRRSILVQYLKVHPVLDPLRDDPRYLALLRRMSLGN